MSDESLLIRSTAKPIARVEIAKSFAYKLDMKRYDPWYENRDFFCSAKTKCKIEDADFVADRLFLFCRRSVVRDLKAYLKEFKEQRQKEVA